MVMYVTVKGAVRSCPEREKKRRTTEAKMEKAIIRDRETGEELTLTALREEYETLKKAGETEAGSFEDYLENITDGNGTCDWI